MPAIALELGVAKSSVSLWVRDVPVLPGNVTVAGFESLRPPKPTLLRDYLARGGAEPSVKLIVWKSGEVRRCSACGNTLPLEMFNRLRDGRQWWCRSCFRLYFRERGDYHRQQSGTARTSRVARARAHRATHLETHPCSDCGEADPVVMEFDHVGTKQAAVAKLLGDGASLARIDAEIAECEVVCVNCHRIRTARRGNWIRGAPDWRARLAGRPRSQAAKIRYAYEALERSGCVDCGQRSLEVLDFDHLRDKVANVSVMLVQDSTLADVIDEIAKCEVRCANCHRRRTAERAEHGGRAAT